MLHKTGLTVQRQSDVQAWSNFNLGRRLFTHMADYDFAIANMLSAVIQKKQSIVEYGCGDGVWLEYLSKQFPDKTFMGVEWNQKLFEYAKNKRLKDLKNVSLYCVDATQVSIKCDVWFAFGVVEHFNEASDVMRKWTETLKPNGFAVVTAPNLLNSLYVAERFKMSLEQLQGKDQVDVNDYGFEQLWSHNTFLKKVMDAGLEILLFRILEELPERAMLTVAFKRGEKI